MGNLVSCFQRLIHPDWLLERNGGEWLLRESQAGADQHGLLRISGGPSLAFSLDKPGADPWPFMKAEQLPGIRKVSDALVLLEKAGQTYVFAIEMKSDNESKALRQIHNARLFTHWVLGLLQSHRHWQGDYGFCGIISFAPRRQERRGVTSRAAALPKPTQSHGYPVFRLHNHPRLNLMDVLESLAGASDVRP
ncbi:hypothetical protein SAMN02949497_1473 [Methylomagnum ishizawai]|uniref:Uncharacterized protein n=1 Tax=Methylomagnum ishizawai TaxID=1760988 RepID=A0A1Y6CV49_9GAMM|nr:hypothetical protein [Methylomagnum ishizawai]SMF94166.1 hypothetical protein SAMN02949497_1473 [Methylomagnum ishizawai]